MASMQTGAVLFLCALSFLVGRFLPYGDTAISSDQTSERIPTQTRKVLTLHNESAAHGLPTGAATAAIDPLDPVQLEHFMLEKSGLLPLRPPLPAADSGDNFYHAIPFQILSWAPRIVVFPSFVDKARCDQIVARATKSLFPSGLAYAPGDHHDSEQQTRTSLGTFLGSDGDGVLEWIEERIAAVTHLPRENGESFNVLRYENNQHYDSHMDSFNPKVFGPQPSQRIATVLVYLSDVEEGGETVFKREGLDGENREITDWRNCDDGSFKYKPRVGDAVLFWSVLPNGDIDERALHGGCPVKKGVKWTMTKWIRSKGGMPAWA